MANRQKVFSKECGCHHLINMWNIRDDIYHLAAYLASRTKSFPKALLEIPHLIGKIGLAFINQQKCSACLDLIA